MEMKTRKYTKEQLVSYLEKHGSTQAEAARIMGTNPRTMNRYLEKGVIPSEWLTKLFAELKDRKPEKKDAKKEALKNAPAKRQEIVEKKKAVKAKVTTKKK